jgi:hypothetical protein
MNNIVTASLEDLSLDKQQKFKALQEYMQVQFLTGVKKDRSGKVARLKEFELSVIRLNDINIEVIPTISKKSPPETTPTKSTVGSGSDELLASYIARLERLEDLEKDRALGFNNNDANSSTPKANPQRSHPSLAPLPVNNDNFTYFFDTKSSIWSVPAAQTAQAKLGRTGRTDAGYRSDRCYGVGARSTFANFCRAKSEGPYFS